MHLTILYAIQNIRVIKTKLGEYVKMEAYLNKTIVNPFILKVYILHALE